MSSLEKTIAYVLMLGLAVACALGFGAYFALVELRESSNWATHTHEVLLAVANIESDLVDAETGQRGYLLTGKKAYLLPYEAALKKQSLHMSAFLALVQDNPQQTDAGMKLQALANRKLAELKYTIQINDQHSQSAALALVLIDEGDKWMAEIRGLGATISARENALLALRKAAANQAFDRVVMVSIAALALYGLLIGLAYIFIRRELVYRRKVEGELRDSNERIRAITDSLPALIVYIDRDERYRFCNRYLQAITGRHPADVLGVTMQEVCKPILYAAVKGYVVQALRGEAVSFDGVMQLGSRQIYHHTEYIPDRGTDGSVRGFYAISFDITARKAAEEAQYQEHERLQVTLNSIGDAVISTNADGNINYLNPVAEAMTGWDDASAFGRSLEDVFKVVNIDSRAKVPNPLKQAMSEKRIIELAADSMLIAKNGAEIAIEDSAAPIRNRAGDVIGGVLVFRDVSKLRTLAVNMTRMAHHDSLTDLPNRLLFRDRLAQSINVAKRKNQRIAVLFCDLDRFKQVNDSLGHAYGDALLKEVANRLVKCVRSSDTISRQGGDEFLVLLQDVQETSSIADTAEKIRTALCVPFELVDQVVNIGASIGISIFPDDGLNDEDLIKNADAAMYDAKMNGRDRFQFFAPAMNINTQNRYELEQDLRNAMAQDDFCLYYQPKFDFLTGDLVGAEALLRWPQGLSKGHTTADLIKFAEQTDLIRYIGLWALQEACSQIGKWQQAGFTPFPVSVNVSALQIRRNNFADQVAQILDTSGIDPHLLELELTESMLIDAEVEAVAQMHKLKKLGVRLSIDDFGTGYSSLNYLKNFPIDTLKIDRAFVSEITIVRHSAAITLAIIALAKSLGLETVAEGIETIEQAQKICEQGCNVMQGYLFARPLMVEHFEVLMRNGGKTNELRQSQSRELSVGD